MVPIFYSKSKSIYTIKVYVAISHQGNVPAYCDHGYAEHFDDAAVDRRRKDQYCRVAAGVLVYV